MEHQFTDGQFSFFFRKFSKFLLSENEERSKSQNPQNLIIILIVCGEVTKVGEEFAVPPVIKMTVNSNQHPNTSLKLTTNR